MLWALLALSVVGAFAAFLLMDGAGYIRGSVEGLPAGYWLYLGLEAVSMGVFFYVLSRIFHQRSKWNRVLLTALLGGFNVVLTLVQISREGWLGRDVLALGAGAGMLVVAAVFVLEPAV